MAVDEWAVTFGTARRDHRKRRLPFFRKAVQNSAAVVYLKKLSGESFFKEIMAAKEKHCRLLST